MTCLHKLRVSEAVIRCHVVEYSLVDSLVVGEGGAGDGVVLLATSLAVGAFGVATALDASSAMVERGLL